MSKAKQLKGYKTNGNGDMFEDIAPAATREGYLRSNPEPPPLPYFLWVLHDLGQQEEPLPHKAGGAPTCAFKACLANAVKP